MLETANTVCAEPFVNGISDDLVLGDNTVTDTDWSESSSVDGPEVI